ncbi:MAG: hypothetical protein ACKOKF_10325 [Bacteroidota bacterium]
MEIWHCDMSCVATCPLSAILDLLKHPLTDIGLAKFLADAKKSREAVAK